MTRRSGIVEEPFPPDRLIVYPSRTRIVLLTIFLFAVALPGGLVWLWQGLRDPDPSFVLGGSVLAIGSLALVVLGLRTLWGGPLLVVDADGLWDPGVGMVRWPEVGEIETTRVNNTKYVVVHIRDLRVLEDSRVLRPRRVRWYLHWAGAPIALAWSQFPGTCEELIERIERYRP